MSATAEATQIAIVTVQSPDGSRQPYELTAENNLIVGSSDSCSIHLEDGCISAMHCLLRLQEDRLSVQDWYTTSGTFLNGEKLNSPSSFGPGDEIRVGDFRITAEFAVAEQKKTEAAARSTQQAEDDFTVLAAMDDAIQGEYDSDTGDRPATEETLSPSGSTFIDGELSSLRQRVTELELENEELRQLSSMNESWSGGDAADPFDREMLELLKSEVEQLQDEVSQRDAQITELAASGGNQDGAETDSSETAALLERLENMLDELQSSDSRIAAMEELLQTADEATQAEQEERRQLTGWVEDIEERFSQREGEWQAQQERLREQVQELTAERGRFDEQLRDLARRQGSTAQAQLVTELRTKVEELQAQIDQSREAREELRTQIDGVEFQQTAEGLRIHVEELLREERLEMAQQRAEVTRERAEMARLKTEFEAHEITRGKHVDDATCRVQALREHLKDIHEREPDQKKAAGIGGRIARLWKRLEQW